MKLLQRHAIAGMRRIAIALLATVFLCAPISVALAGDGWFTTWAGPAQDPGATSSTFPANTWNVAQLTSEISSSLINCLPTGAEVTGSMPGFTLPIAATDAPLANDNDNQQLPARARLWFDVSVGLPLSCAT